MMGWTPGNLGVKAYSHLNYMNFNSFHREEKKNQAVWMILQFFTEKIFGDGWQMTWLHDWPRSNKAGPAPWRQVSLAGLGCVSVHLLPSGWAVWSVMHPTSMKMASSFAQRCSWCSGRLTLSCIYLLIFRYRSKGKCIVWYLHDIPKQGDGFM